MKEVRATVITDASYCDLTKKAGWAAWIRVDGIDEPIKKYGSFKSKVKSSTDAEKMASINGIYIAKMYGATKVLVQTDCMLVVHLTNGITKKQSLVDRWSYMLSSNGLADILLEARHVRGHTTVNDARSYVNRWCDSKANEGRLSA